MYFNFWLLQMENFEKTRQQLETRVHNIRIWSCGEETITILQYAAVVFAFCN